MESPTPGTDAESQADLESTPDGQCPAWHLQNRSSHARDTSVHGPASACDSAVDWLATLLLAVGCQVREMERIWEKVSSPNRAISSYPPTDAGRGYVAVYHQSASTGAQNGDPRPSQIPRPAEDDQGRDLQAAEEEEAKRNLLPIACLWRCTARLQVSSMTTDLFACFSNDPNSCSMPGYLLATCWF